jgi:hypothetical protein
MKKRTRTILQYVLSCLVVIVPVGYLGIWNAAAQFQEMEDLRARGRVAQAVVTATQCSNHGNVSYEFEHAGKRYGGTSNSCGRTCSANLVGATMEVRYLEEDPLKSECGHLDGKIQELLILVALMIGFCLFAGAILAVRCRSELRIGAAPR